MADLFIFSLRNGCGVLFDPRTNRRSNKQQDPLRSVFVRVEQVGFFCFDGVLCARGHGPREVFFRKKLKIFGNVLSRSVRMSSCFRLVGRARSTVIYFSMSTKQNTKIPICKIRKRCGTPIQSIIYQYSTVKFFEAPKSVFLLFLAFVDLFPLPVPPNPFPSED